MKRNPVICLLVAGLLIVSLTGQAAAAFRMACEGTAACCCRTTEAMPDVGFGMAAMAGGCCDVPESRPCDLAGPGSAPAAPFLPTESISFPEASEKLISILSMASPAIDANSSARRFIESPNFGDPPTYLLTQTFLC